MTARNTDAGESTTSILGGSQLLDHAGVEVFASTPRHKTRPNDAQHILDEEHRLFASRSFASLSAGDNVVDGAACGGRSWPVRSR